MAMSILEREEELPSLEWGSAEHLHRAVAAMRLAFVDALQYNAVRQASSLCSAADRQCECDSRHRNVVAEAQVGLSGLRPE